MTYDGAIFEARTFRDFARPSFWKFHHVMQRLQGDTTQAGNLVGFLICV